MVSSAFIVHINLCAVWWFADPTSLRDAEAMCLCVRECV